MSHYDELRERDASMTMEEKEKVRDVDLLISSLQRMKADWYGDSDE